MGVIAAPGLNPAGERIRSNGTLERAKVFNSWRAGVTFDSEMRDKAVELIRDAFEMAARMTSVDLEAVNRPRPENLRYSSRADLVREFTSSASAMLNFAGQLGLISQSEAVALLQEMGSAHPELDAELMK